MTHDRRTFLQAIGATGIGTVAVGTAGAQDSAGEIVVEGGGADIWNEADECHYYFTDVGEHFDATVRVDSVEDTDEYAKAGLMLRESLEADAKNVMVRTTPDHTSLQWRPSAGSESTSLTSDAGEGESEIDGGEIDAAWQRLVRSGDTIRAYASEDGDDWTLVAELSLSFDDSVFLGLAVTSHDSGTLCEAQFSNLGGVAPVESRDIGDVDVSGTASGSSSGDAGPLIVTGSAADVTSSSATLSSTVYSLGGASSAAAAIEYREAGGSWTTSAAETVAEPGALEVEVTGLSPETEYEYRAVVEAGGADDVGEVVEFATPEVDTDPSVTTGEAVDVSSSSATLSSTLEDLGGQATEALVSFEYRETGADEWQDSGSQTLQETGEFESTIYGLSPDTEYEYRAVVEADDGDADIGSTATVSTEEGSAGAGPHFGLEDGFADVDWFDDDVEVIRITELDYDAIEDAFQTEGPRLIVFQVSGVLDLENRELEITEPYCWVAGQTAPSPGVTFTNGFVQADASNVVLEHVRVFRGDESGGEGTDPMNSADGTENVIFNHCTSFWGRDENLSVGYDSSRTTIANCMIAEGLEDPEENSNGTLVGDGAEDVAILGTIYAKNNDRNPRLKEDTRTVVANNLNFYHDKAIWIDGGAEASVVGNAYLRRFSFRDPVVFGDGSVHMEDNYVADPPLDGRPFSDIGTELDDPPLWPDGLEALPAGDVESHNKTFAGARPADRIGQEQKVVDQITERWGSLDVDPNRDNAGFSDIPDSAAEAGGYPDHGGTTHSLDVPDVGLREWLEHWSQTVTVGDGSLPDVRVATGEADDVAADGATLEGSLEDFGEASSVSVGFEYRETTADDDEWERTATQTLSSTGEFSQDVDGLESGTEYEFRAVAETDDGTVTGFAATFRTSFERDGEGGSHYAYTDGFSTPAPWLENEDVQVITITEPDYGQVKEAVQTSGPRVIVFECSGTIEIEDETLEISEDKCWIAGQTAPSPGITFVKGQFQVDADDCVIQHIRSRHGPGSEAGDVQSNDAVNTDNDATNTVFDHVTASWGTDECMSIGYYGQRNTMVNCLAYEGLWDPYGESTDHNYATLIGDENEEVFLAGNVWAKTRGRVPRLKDDTETVVVNNFAYFFDESASIDSSAVTTFVGNGYTGLTDDQDEILEGGGTVYLEDNFTADPPLDDTDFASSDSEAEPPLWPDGLEVFPSERVEEHNLRYAGARPADRTYHDRRIVEEIRNRAGNDRLDDPYEYWVGHQDDVGGFPDLEVNYHDLDVPDADLRAWLEQWALAVEEPDAAPPGEGDATDTIEVGDYDARDSTGDGRYDDFDGDGETTHDDVTAFFEHLEDDAVQNNPDAFDFADNGEIGFSDVIELLREV